MFLIFDVSILQPCSQLKGETVEKHPLSRSSSTSSASSAEFDGTEKSQHIASFTSKRPLTYVFVL